MMGAEKTLVNVNKGQDPYSVIGNYILNHVTVIEDIIAVIQINGVVIKELYMADVDADGYFYWKGDWWEGEEDIALLDFFPVSDAEKIKWIPVTERLPSPDLWDERYLVSFAWGGVGIMEYKSTGFYNYGSFAPVPIETVTAWMPRPKPWKGETE